MHPSTPTFLPASLGVRTAHTALCSGNGGPEGFLPARAPKGGSPEPAARAHRPGGQLTRHVPSALRDRLLAETPEHCQSCQTISLPGFYKNPRPRCPMPNTLLRQHLQGLWAPPSTAAFPRPYIGKSWGIPLPSAGLGSQGGRHSLRRTLGLSRLPDGLSPARGAR